MRSLIAVALCSFAAVGGVSAAEALPAQGGERAAAAFATLQALAGHWQGRFDDGRTHEVSFRPTAGGTVLVETWQMGNGRESMTVYHRDGDRLIATHYCPQGNQPRLVLADARPGDGGRLQFDFLDGTGLQDRERSHQHTLWIEAVDVDHFSRGERYARNGGTAEGEDLGSEDRASYTRVE